MKSNVRVFKEDMEMGTRLLNPHPTVWKKMGVRASTAAHGCNGQVALGAR